MSRVPETSVRDVAVIVAVRNEERHIAALLDQLAAQTYPADHLEIMVADGRSTDNTRQIVEDWHAAHPHGPSVQIVDNPRIVTAAGLNAGIDAASGELVVIVGGHAEVPPDFVADGVRALQESGAECAGGRIVTVGRTATGRAVAAALSSPFGVGSATFRTGGEAPGEVDTVAFGTYRRSVLESLGGFDPDLVGAEDDDLNFRILRSGGRIWFDPAITSTYFCRESYAALARQYWSYGRGKARLLRKHGGLPSPRALAPPALVVGVAGSVAAAAVSRHLWPAVVAIGPYLVAGAAAAVAAARPTGVSAVRTWAAFGVIHATYGSGMIVGVLSGWRRRATSWRSADNLR